jgi:23S rRNA G2445 N2-methylase RlmL
VHVQDDEALLGVRLGEHPPHRRAYRTQSRTGSLHPPLARALALVAGLREGVNVVDPFCGAGTIPIEAALADERISSRGFDIDGDVVDLARSNARAAKVVAELEVADAASLGETDCIVTNPPWGKAVPAARVALQARRLVLLTAEPTGLDQVVLEQTVRVHGALATISVVERP